MRPPGGAFKQSAFEVSALGAQVALSLTLRAIAWPEITTPAYLWSRGLLLYRDIKFVHTPGTMGILASLFLLFGARAAVLKAFVAAAALFSHGFLLAQTRGLSLLSRLLASAFFLAFSYGWQGNSVWPTALIAVLALPLARALEQRRWKTAGILLGSGILIKQTAAYLLILVLARLAANRRFREMAGVALLAAAPYFTAAAAFSLLGAGREFFEWTLIVPLRIARAIHYFPGFGAFGFALLCAFLPLTIDTAEELRDDAAGSAGWLFVTAAGLALLAFPRFDLLEVSASVPCLALGAARLTNRTGTWKRLFFRLLVAALVLPQAVALALGERFDGKILFWNDDPALNTLIERLAAHAPAGPLHSVLWPNVLPQTGRLPPGRLYVHPWLTYLFPFDDVGERVRRAALRPGTILVGPRGLLPGGVACGPFAFEPVRPK